MDAFILRLLQLALTSDDSCFLDYLARAKNISVRRGNKYFGFEWLVHATLANYLFQNGNQHGISDLAIGTVHSNGLKPDIFFRYSNTDVIIELKTIENNQFSWCSNDVSKWKNKPGRRYVVACAYRNRPNRMPGIANIQYVGQFNINQNFRVVLMSVI